VFKWTKQPKEPTVHMMNRREGVHMCFADYVTRILLTRLVGTWALLFGIVFTIGGFDRISTASFGTINRVPFAPASWGIPLALVGLVVLILALQPVTLDKRGHTERLIMQCGLFLMAVWNLTFAIAFLIEIFRVPVAAVSGPFAYGMNAAVCLVLMVAHRVWDSHAE
jgi:hypothetical protein